MARRLGPLVAAALLVIGGILALRALRHDESAGDAKRSAGVHCSQLDRAFEEHRSLVWLTLSARVTELLPDQAGAYRHQRFIVSCPSGRTVLIVNDVSVGQRAPIRPGEEVIVRGQYVWNRLGGLVHFTHHSDSGGQGGWIYAGARLYSLGQQRVPLNATS